MSRFYIPRGMSHDGVMNMIENEFERLGKRIEELEKKLKTAGPVTGRVKISCTCNADYTGTPHDKHCAMRLAGLV